MLFAAYFLHASYVSKTFVMKILKIQLKYLKRNSMYITLSMVMLKILRYYIED